MNRTADIVVIGAGTAGLSAFHTIDRANRSVLLVEGGPLGTMCARVGCMPSKAVLHAGRGFGHFRVAEVDLSARSAFALACWREARAVRDRLVDSVVRSTIESAGDRLVRGSARFLDPATIDVDGTRITARAFVVATGSHPIVPDFLAPFASTVLTTDTLFELDALPASVGVLGLGAVGLEMSLALSRLGVSTIAADNQRHVGGVTDPVVNERAIRVLGEEVVLWLGEEASVTANGGGFEFRSARGVVHVERLLAAVGRRPTIAGLDLTAAGVVVNVDGRIDVDLATTRCRGTSVFLAGDVSPDRPLQHEAVDEGSHAARAAIALIDQGSSVPFRRRTPLSIVFTDPDIGQVGKRFDELDAASVVIGEAEGKDNGRSRIMNAESNLVRVYVDRPSRKLVGATLFAVEGEHLAHHLAWAVQREATLDELLALPFYHPTFEELMQSAFKNAAQALKA